MKIHGRRSNRKMIKYLTTLNDKAKHTRQNGIAENIFD